MSTIAETQAPPFADDERRACRGKDPTLFFPATDGSGAPAVRQAKRICWHCPLAEECFRYALPITDLFGIWGATTRTERQRYRQLIAGDR